MSNQRFIQAPDEEISTWAHLADLLIVSGLLTILILCSSAFLLTLGFLPFNPVSISCLAINLRVDHE